MPTPGALDAPQHAELIILVGDPETRVEPHVRAVLAKQVRAKRVNRAARYVARGVAETRDEPMGDFAGRLVREGERANPRWIDVVLLDQKADAFGQAKRFAGAGSCQHQERLGFGLYR